MNHNFFNRPTCKICTDIIINFFEGDLFLLFTGVVEKKWQNILIVRGKEQIFY